MSHPVACFASLPQELKANVLERIADAEGSWKQRLKTYIPEDQPGRKKAHVDGLRVASLVCKEWHSLASKFIFATLTFNGTKAPLFRHGILRTHGHRFKKVLLVQHDGEDDGDEDEEDSQFNKSTIELDYALSILPFLPNLRALTLNDSAAYHLFGSDLDIDVHRDDAKGMRSLTLRQIAESIDDLHLVKFSPTEVHRVLSSWRRVRRLRLEKLSAIATDAEMDEVVKAITGLKCLQYLNIELVDSTDALRTPPIGWTPEALAALQSDPPPLAFLILSIPEHHQRNLDFASIFSPTLRFLRLNSVRQALNSTPSPPLHFPNLTELILYMEEETPEISLSTILPAFFTSPLIDLTIADGTCAIDLGVQCPLTLLSKNLPTLRLLNVNPINAAEQSLVTTFCTARDLLAPTLTPFERPDYTDGITDEQNDLLCDGLDGVLDWGKLEVVRLRAGRRVADSVALLESLRQLDSHRQRWMD